MAAAAVTAALLGAGPAAAQQTLKFGLAMPLTGSQSAFGKDQIKAAEWAVADINAKGGVNGKKLEMIVLDTQADPTIGINMVNRLVNVDKAGMFITAWSAVVKAQAPVANREKVLQISVGANSPDIARLGDWLAQVRAAHAAIVHGASLQQAREVGVATGREIYALVGAVIRRRPPESHAWSPAFRQARA